MHRSTANSSRPGRAPIERPDDETTPPHLWTKQFILLCLSSVFFFCSFNLIIAELPAWLELMDSKEFLPFIIPLFTLAALISRPFSGHWADTIGRRPIMFTGMIVSGLCGLAYPWFFSISGFLLLRFLHGFSTGFAPTGTTALLTDLIAPQRRGEGMGILGIASGIGLAGGPAFGSWIALNYGYQAMFMTASAFAVLSIAVVLTIDETVENPVPFSLQSIRIPRSAVYEPRVFMPALMALLYLFPFGVLITIVPDKSDILLIENRGLFFVLYVLASMAIRLPAGKLSDRLGRSTLLMVATLIVGTAMFGIAFAESKNVFLAWAVFGGLGAGIGSPILFAWTADLSDEAHRARGFSTTFMALEIGIGAGGLIGGSLYANDPSRIHIPFLVAAGVCFVAASILIARRIRNGEWN